jgi:hypothetical protein
VLERGRRALDSNPGGLLGRWGARLKTSIGRTVRNRGGTANSVAATVLSRCVASLVGRPKICSRTKRLTWGASTAPSVRWGVGFALGPPPMRPIVHLVSGWRLVAGRALCFLDLSGIDISGYVAARWLSRSSRCLWVDQGRCVVGPGFRRVFSAARVRTGVMLRGFWWTSVT